jgi:hypothetical protein
MVVVVVVVVVVVGSGVAVERVLGGKVRDTRDRPNFFSPASTSILSVA